MVLALVLLGYALILGALLSCTSSAGKADDRDSRLIQLSLRALVMSGPFFFLGVVPAVIYFNQTEVIA